jgi:hypothetical protein
MTPADYEAIRETRKTIVTTIGSVESGERAELWHAIDWLDGWLSAFEHKYEAARYEAAYGTSAA